MSRPLIGRTVRRLRMERGLTQQALADRLGVSPSYLNLIEHDQRAVTASLLIKLGTVLQADLHALSGTAERHAEVALREVFSDPLLGLEQVPEAELQAVAASAPNATRAVLAVYRAWQVAREDATGIALPSGRRLLLPVEEARNFFHERLNHFPAIEEAAEGMAAAMHDDPDRSIVDCLRTRHGIRVVIEAGDTFRRFDPETRVLHVSESLSRASRTFRLAFQLMLLELHDVMDAEVTAGSPSTPEAAGLIRIGLCNYAAAALLMPYVAMLTAAEALRYDVEALSARFGVSFEQAAHRLSTLQRPTARGIPFFFMRVDPAGNVDKRFSAAGFPFARFGGSCPRWIVHTAFASPDRVSVEAAELPDGTAFLCIARVVTAPHSRVGEPVVRRVVALGCDIDRAPELEYSAVVNLSRRVGIGLSCRLCDRADCKSRAFPPLQHRLLIDPNQESASPWRFSRERSRHQ